jgi:5-deoxy-D-glucuronate isomerase
LKRIYHPSQDGPFLLNLNPKIIGWKYLSFQVARLTQDQTLQDDSKSEEVVIVPLAGNGLLFFNDETLELGRDDLFRQKPDIAYLPPRTKYRLATERLFEFAIGIPVQNGDVVVIHEGYHPVVNAPGTNTYYLNFLAGDVRKISAVNDPNYDWVGTHWERNPIEIPVQR